MIRQRCRRWANVKFRRDATTGPLRIAAEVHLLRPQPRFNPHRRRPAPRGSVQTIVSEVPKRLLVDATLCTGTSDTILCFFVIRNTSTVKPNSGCRQWEIVTDVLIFGCSLRKSCQGRISTDFRILAFCGLSGIRAFSGCGVARMPACSRLAMWCGTRQRGLCWAGLRGRI